MGSPARTYDPDSDLASTKDDPPTTKTSFFSRLTLPLRSRVRNIGDFHVKADNPHRHYNAGDHVTGSVILSVIKPIRLTHLTVSLHGYVRVFKNTAAAAQPPPTLNGLAHDGTKNFRYHGNGYATLFQDEQVLCGEGRLASRRWEFKFELMFPERDLPSSIDFERGTISYVITATLTRPAQISPMTTAERKISLVERVDVGMFPPPRPRKVSMQALQRRQRRRKNGPTSTNGPKGPGVSDNSDLALETMNSRAPDGSGSTLDDQSQTRTDDNQPPRSPIASDLQSEFSGDSVASRNSSILRGVDPSGTSIAGSRTSGNAGEEHEITATVELSKGGFLPGELLSVKIKVHHNRFMKSMHGIIITLYRQGRVDYSPPDSLFSSVSGDSPERMEREEFFPKSKTGLGGLSLSSAGSCSVFRKDLSQTVVPLIIDPVTLSANIATAIKIPDDVFPSIRGIPGGLMGFRYYVEVVADLGGRLAGQGQGTSQQPGRTNPSAAFGAGSGPSKLYEAQLARLANWNGAIIDTDHLRREKGVISVSFEVVMGNVDTSRARSKAIERPPPALQTSYSQDDPMDYDRVDRKWHEAQESEPGRRDELGSYHDQHEAVQDYYPPHPSSLDDRQYQESPSQAPVYIPPPEISDRSAMSEKDRIRQAEQQLLPSQPPPEHPGSEASSSQPLVPPDLAEASAPTLPEPSAAVGPFLDTDGVRSGDIASAPIWTTSTPGTEIELTDDKQEMERRRLMQEASVPRRYPDDTEIGEPSAPDLDVTGPSNYHEPSAPVLNEDDEGFGSHDPYETIAGPSRTVDRYGGGGQSEQLPRYER